MDLEDGEDDLSSELTGILTDQTQTFPPAVEVMLEEAGMGRPEPEATSEADYGEDEEVFFVEQECTGLQDIVFTGLVCTFLITEIPLTNLTSSLDRNAPWRCMGPLQLLWTTAPLGRVDCPRWVTSM